MASIISIIILKKQVVSTLPAILIKETYHLAQFPQADKEALRKYCMVNAVYFVSELQNGTLLHQRVEDFMIHVYVRSTGIAAVLITSARYPPRSAHRVLWITLEMFCRKCPDWDVNDVSASSFAGLEQMLTRYQDPTQAENLSTTDLDAFRKDAKVKVAMHLNKTKLQQLAAKTQALFGQAKLLTDLLDRILSHMESKPVNV